MNLPLNIFKTFQNISHIDNRGRFQGESNIWASDWIKEFENANADH